MTWNGPCRSHLSLLIFLLLAGTYLAVRWVPLTADCLDGDEIFSLRAARQNWTGLLAVTAEDVSHPPLFYGLLKLWIAVGGQSLLWVRLLPWAIAAGALLPLWLLCRDLPVPYSVANGGLALVAVNNFHVAYSTHLRMFVLLYCFSVWSLWLFARWLRQPEAGRTLWCLTLVNLLLVYSHYWGWVFVGTQGLYLLCWRRELVRRFSVSTGIVMIGFLPWVGLVAYAIAQKGSAVSQISWITRPGVDDLVYFYATLSGTFPVKHSTRVGLSLFLVPVLLGLWRSHRPGGSATTARLLWLLTLFAVVPPVLTFGASLVLPQSVWAERQLIIAVVPFLLLVATAVSGLRPVGLRVGVTGLMLTWAGAAGALAFEDMSKPPWDQLVAEVIGAEPAGSQSIRVFALEGFVFHPIDFHLEQARQPRFQAVRVAQLDEVSGGHFWFAYRIFDWKEQRSPPEILAAKGFRVGQATTIGTGEQQVLAFPVWRQ